MTRDDQPTPAPSTAPKPSHRICELRSATVRYAERVVLREIDVIVGPTTRLAVIGDNGSGKTTLLAALAGVVPVAAGERRVELPGGMAYAEQNPTFPAGTSVGSALDLLLGDLRVLEADIARLSHAVGGATEAELPALLTRLARANDAFEARDGYALDVRLASALQQLGLGDLDRARPVAELSGGERSRLALAATLASEAELLLLDEPTNDLDDAGIAWMEDKLARHRGSMVVVTHDRAFLDRFATDIVAIEQGTLRRYGDGYRGFLTARATERRAAVEAHRNWREELTRHVELLEANAFRLDAIPRKQEKAAFGHGAFRLRGRDHGAKSRIRNAKERVSRLLADPAPRPPDPLRFNPVFGGADPRENGSPLVTVENVRLGADGAGPRLAMQHLAVCSGERWLVSGANGAGKTTLLRLLAGELTPESGQVERDETVRVAWLRQGLAPFGRATVLRHFAAKVGVHPDDAARPLLALGLFDKADLVRPVSRLSVGQQCRLELAIALSVPSDLLLLDEPTNHLAPELVEQLESALDDYPGTVVTVTHDRRWRERAERNHDVRRIEVVPPTWQ